MSELGWASVFLDVEYTWRVLVTAMTANALLSVEGKKPTTVERIEGSISRSYIR